MKKLLTLLITFLLLPSTVFGAIAHFASYDATSVFTGSFDGSSGANRVIVFRGSADSSDNITSVTWNGENFTKFITVNFAAIGRYNVLWCLQPSGTGSQSYAINGITTSSILTFSVYTGAGNCKNAVHTTGTGTTGSVSASPAPAADSWMVGGGGNDAAAIVMGANTTNRGVAGSSQAGVDSNGVASPTAFNFSFGGGSANWAAYDVEIPAASNPAKAFWLFSDF